MTTTIDPDAVLRWFATGAVGLSSKAMASHLCGLPCSGDYPRDPDDLNRCLLFLAAVPGARDALPRMATLNPVWAALVERWPAIEAAFLDEVGLAWCHGSRAPRTYNLMRAAIDAGREKQA